ncbi:DUF1329 domain-containing protein [Noviherbaspirillum sedimenti]|uniref:DUF1329 domain-containing protein n=1 Tax=Noviherbaspirillum sedimenti TaxID=2320865 RepID=A0A3A3G2G9_9BURK|nr:DUF1329 domain-containing protein [Noviherbaspirillum sedimenti]RJG02688.1 DUF1329 domain-containing protein [Noviherbaspirillum sedimenti]
MNLNIALIGLVACISVTGTARAAVSPDEMKKLGTTLTPWGAEKAANASGTIPAYTGGIIEMPPGFVKSNPGVRPDPFDKDKPLYRIDAKNAEQHNDKLTPGTLALIRKYPTFYVDVYPTHRSATYPSTVLENTVKNAERCALIADGDGLDTSKGCGFGLPFPIPKSGLEVMWNHAARYRGLSFVSKNFSTYYVKPSGEIVVTQRSNLYRELGLYDTRKNPPDTFGLVRLEYYSPARLNGQTTQYYDRVADSERRAWSYQPSTRRVRLAPDLAGDAPVSTVGGAMVYDEEQIFSGKRDRYNWKLVGKKEVLIPYNAYKLTNSDNSNACKGDAKLLPNHLKSECVRWEMHRVWHVQATLKEGKRHVYQKRDFFLDEDTFAAGIEENYDKSGSLYRVNINPGVPAYDLQAPGITDQYILDLVTGIYIWMSPEGGHVHYPALAPSSLTPESMTTHILKP